MEIDFAYLGPFSVPILQKNVSTLMFCYEKLIMRTFFTHVAITDQNWVYFFTPSALMTAHSAVLTLVQKTSYVLIKPYFNSSDFDDTSLFSRV